MRHSFAPFGRHESAFLSEMTGVDFTTTDFTRDWLCVSARDDAGALMGLCAFEFKVWFDAYFTVAIRDRRCLTRRVLHAMFTAVFTRAVRVTAEIEPGNQKAIDQAHRMGFTIEGYKPLAIEGRRDAILLGMTKDRCPFFRTRWRASQGHRKEIDNGKHTKVARSL